MLLLPTLHARLLPCSESWAAMTPVALGRHCARCQRVVQDFTQSQNPAADLAAARAAAPDGRVCGRFAGAQAQAPHPLTRRLRWFLVALVLVVAQGLSAREALAQVRQGAMGQALRKAGKHQSVKKKTSANNQEMSIGVVLDTIPTRILFQGGGSATVVAFVQRNVKYQPDSEGQVVASFIVDSTGHVRRPIILKSLTPAANAEVIRIIESLTGFEPATQNGVPISTTVSVPVTFKKPKPQTP